MKEIKETREVIVGYEALDGTRFQNENECKQYEKSARGAIKAQWQSIAKQQDHYDCLYISDDDCIRLIDLNSVERLTIANMYAQSIGMSAPFSDDMIGKTVAVNTGYDDCDIFGIYTRQQMIDKFMDIVNQIFGPTDSNED